MKIITKLLNESEKKGSDKIPSLNALFPRQNLGLKIIDHFNLNKSKKYIEVPSDITLYELRVCIGRKINCYPHEMKLSVNNVEIDPRLNGHIIYTVPFKGDIVVEKICEIPREVLTNSVGELSAKAKHILSIMFAEYSTAGMMSKQQCQKYQQRCLGEVSAMSESRVNNIYEKYDKNGNGLLSFEDFLCFYGDSAKNKPSAIWSNF